LPIALIVTRTSRLDARSWSNQFRTAWGRDSAARLFATYAGEFEPHGDLISRDRLLGSEPCLRPAQ